MSQSSTWKDVAETPAMVAYLEELLDAGFDTVRREPERLEEQGARLHRQLQDLAFHEYKSFIQSAECTKTTREQFYQMNEHIGGLLHRLPHLKQQCNEFTANVAEINAKRKANQLVLQHHAQLLELLELPQLMDTCVRNGYYDEALNVEAHVQRLKTRFEQNAIVQDIVRPSPPCLACLSCLCTLGRRGGTVERHHAGTARGRAADRHQAAHVPQGHRQLATDGAL